MTEQTEREDTSWMNCHPKGMSDEQTLAWYRELRSYIFAVPGQGQCDILWHPHQEADIEKAFAEMRARLAATETERSRLEQSFNAEFAASSRRSGRMSYAVWPDGPTGDVVREVYEERGRQEEKWGQQNHDEPEYFAILAEEFGEAAKEVVEIRFYNGPTNNPDYINRMKNLRTELLQTAAVAVAFIECLERNNAWIFKP